MEDAFRVLIIDNDRVMATNLKDILDREGYEVALADNGQAAVDLCEKRAFNVALMDVNLPDAAGLDLTHRLEPSCPGMEIIIVTGNAGLDSAVEAVRHRRVVGYETKPLDIMRLLLLIKQVKERQQAQDELRQSESRLRLVLEQMPCTLWTTNAELQITSAMGAAASLALAPAGPVTGRNPIAWPQSEECEPAAILAHRSALQGVADSYRLEWCGKTMFCHVEPMRDTANSIIGVIGIATDVSGQERHEDELRALSQRMAEAQENERRTIARELHDELGQSLTALKIMLDRVAVKTDGYTAVSLKEASTLLGSLMAWTREFTLDLRPTMLDDLGLVATMQWYVDRYTRQTKVPAELTHSGRLKNLPGPVNTAAFRIVQEALTNVARHARSGKASVVLARKDGTLLVQVNDRGTGFDARKLTAESAVGISSMRERAVGLGGTFKIESIRGSGTCVTAELPLAAPAKGGKRRRKTYEQD